PPSHLSPPSLHAALPILAASPFQAHKAAPPEVRRRPEHRHRSVSLRLVLIASFIILGISPVLFFAVNFIPKAEKSTGEMPRMMKDRKSTRLNSSHVASSY